MSNKLKLLALSSLFIISIVHADTKYYCQSIIKCDGYGNCSNPVPNSPFNFQSMWQPYNYGGYYDITEVDVFTGGSVECHYIGGDIVRRAPMWLSATGNVYADPNSINPYHDENNGFSKLCSTSEGPQCTFYLKDPVAN